jgi:hypothetical protein
MKLFLISLLLPIFAYAGSPQGIPTMTVATVGTSNVVALAANPNRGYLGIQNQGTGVCQVSFGAAIASTEGVQLQINQYYEPTEAYLKAAVYMKCANASQTIQFVESNF